MLPLIIMAVCGAAGAVAGVFTTKAANEKDRQAVKLYEKVNAELINNRDRLEKQYYELSDRSKKQIKDLNLKLAESEMEKDALRLAISLQNNLIFLMETIDKNPSLEILAEFKKAVVLTNHVLKELGENLVPVSQDYFSRALVSVDRTNNYSKQQLFDFMAVLMNSEQDTITSLLGEVQNKISQQQVLDSENVIKKSKVKIVQSQSASPINNVEYFIKQGINYIEAEKFEEALNYFNEAISLEPDNEQLWYYQSQVFYFLNQNNKALDLIDRAIRINPSIGLYYCQQSLCLSELGLDNEAINSLNRAIHLEPNQDIYLFAKSKLLYFLKEYKQALYYAERAIEINPDYHYAWYHQLRDEIIK